jgi:hypothetical protein
MSFSFFSNRINTGTTPSLSELVKAAQTKQALGGTIKTASSEDKDKSSKKEEAKDWEKSESTLENEVDEKLSKSKEDKKEDKDEDKSVSKKDEEKTEKEEDTEGKDKDEKKEVTDWEKSEKDTKASSHKFVKIANLTSKQKAVLTEYWKAYYPEAYIKAILGAEY